MNCYNSFIIPTFEYCSPVWCSGAVSHLRLLDRNISAIKFLITELVGFWHRRAVNSLCMLLKILYHTSDDPVHALFPDMCQPLRVTRNADGACSLILIMYEI